MQPASKNPERRDRARLTHVSEIQVSDLQTGFSHIARMFNYSHDGLYFESDSLLAVNAEVFVGIQQTPYEKNSSDYDCYRAIITWHRELPEDSHFYHGYGAKLIAETLHKEINSNYVIKAKKNRKHRRRDFKKSITFASGDRVFSGSTVNISPTGVFIKSDCQVCKGQTVKLAIPDKKGKNVLIQGKVVWSGIEGFGVKFVQKT
jgi:hypothetical protein